MCFVFSGEGKIVEEQARAAALVPISGLHHIKSHHLLSSLRAGGSSRI